ncbi:OmpA family protein [Patiriisocius sp. Uisw_047]|jgi:OOP family OmpA-OmpF porin|uniref:OmpA family protein n=1 Tax=Patiriisocius sp. Uisw_047 TaxID=3230969 RepID=UPI0039E7CC33
MKHLNILFVAACLVLGFSSANAQDENNPWAVEIGVNAVDTFPVGLRDGQTTEDSMNGEFASEFFNIEDHWNILPSVSRLAISRYVGSNFSIGVAGTINRIEKVGDVIVDDLSYYGADGEIKYSFRDLVNGAGGWLDPSLGIGGGYTWLNDQGFGTANGIVSVRFWLSEQFALNAQSAYKYAFDDATGTKHMQHSLGLVFKFGGSDRDGDGIYDQDDECPDTPGLAEFNGCPDTDGDGIEDREDACPDAAGSAEMMGCPDTDGDGLADNKDNCPTEAGPAANDGCPWPDTDGDSVLDKDDACPDEAGSAANNGCADRDGDSVLDKDDECPDVPGTVARKGCPEPQITTEIMEQLNQYSRTILFDYNKTTVRQDSYSAIQSMIDIMNEYETTNFLIEGHSDSSGRDTYNLELSEKRASSVKLYLESKGVDSARLSSLGYGETRPKASNQTSAGRQENRRVEVSLVK